MSKKLNTVRIIQISIVEKDGSIVIYGLGDDSMIYRWLSSSHEWKLFASND